MPHSCEEVWGESQALEWDGDENHVTFRCDLPFRVPERIETVVVHVFRMDIIHLDPVGIDRKAKIALVIVESIDGDINPIVGKDSRVSPGYMSPDFGRVVNADESNV
jgi:hypothetical protein